MSSREKILSAIKQNCPSPFDPRSFSESGSELEGPAFARALAGDAEWVMHSELISKFSTILQTIGGHCKLVKNFNEIIASINHQFPEAKRTISTFKELEPIAEIYCNTDTIQSAENIDIAILSAHFGVAENAAVFLTEELMCDRVIPFITQHLIIILSAKNIITNMHEAYERIADKDYSYSLFIAGPSKTADIEQSLVLGAHGPISMTVFILE